MGRSDPGAGSVLSDLTTTTVQLIDVSLNSDESADNVIFEGRPLADDLMVSVSNGIVKVAGLSYDLRINGAEVFADRLTVNGNEGNDTIKAISGVEAVINITLSGNQGNDFLSADAILNGGDGDDTLEGGAGADTLNGGAGNDTYIPQGGVDTVTDTSGVDVILIDGTAGNDNFLILRTGVGGADLEVTVNGLVTTYSGYATAGVDRIIVNGLEGDDNFTVFSGNGAIQLPIEFAGGSGSFDILGLTDGTATSNFYFLGQNPGEGQSSITIGGQAQSVTFSGVEPVFDSVGGPLQVVATDADNTITFAGTVIAIDSEEGLFISNKTDVSIFGLGGSDTISVNGAAGLSGLLNVNGGDPTASDTLIVNGTIGDNLINYSPSTVIGAGNVTIAGLPTTSFGGIEHLTISGQGGSDDLTITTPTGFDQITLNPGPVVDQGSVTMRRSVALGAGLGAPVLFEHWRDGWFDI